MAGKYQEYPAYINSEVTWLGTVPEHWIPIRFKHRLFEKKKTSNSKLEAGSISFGRVIYKSTENLSPETKASYQEVLVGEFLINPLNMNYDLLSLRTALSKINVVVSTGYIVTRCDNRLNKRYVRWLLQEFDVAHMKTLGSGVRQTINYMDIGNSFFYEPTKNEQDKIAEFLDHETAQIDTLIDRQQQLIKLLKEKRQAVISHAATKGLNPDAAVKDSGVEWLGEVPKHWNVSRFKYLISDSAAGPYGSSLTTSMYTSSGIRVYGQQQVIPDDLSIGDYYISERKFQDMRRYEVFPNELLISVMGTVGRVTVVPEGIERGIINPRLVKYKVMEDKILPHFAKASILSDVSQSQLLFAAQGSTMDGLNMQIIGELPVPYPESLDEQLNILNEIQRKSDKYDKLLKKSFVAVELLNERRTALISAAVTGKIDVRNWQAPQIISCAKTEGVNE